MMYQIYYTTKQAQESGNPIEMMELIEAQSEKGAREKFEKKYALTQNKRVVEEKFKKKFGAKHDESVLENEEEWLSNRIITKVFEKGDKPLTHAIAPTNRIQVSLDSVKPNPFRNIKKYPLDQAKIDALKASIDATDYWENVLARITPNSNPPTYELAYGHHRIEAARQKLGGAAKVWMTVRDMDDRDMLKIMALENDEAYTITPTFVLETVEAARGLFVSKQIEVGCQHPTLCYDGETQECHTIHNFLEWPVLRVKVALARLNDIKEDGLAPEAIAELKTQAAVSELAKVVKKAKAEGKPISAKKQKEMAAQVTANVEQAAEKTIAAEMAKAENPPEEKPEPTNEEQWEKIVSELAHTSASMRGKLENATSFLSKHPAQKYKDVLRESSATEPCSEIGRMIRELFALAKEAK